MAGRPRSTKTSKLLQSKRREVSPYADKDVLKKLTAAARSIGMSLEELTIAAAATMPQALPKAAGVDDNGIIRMQSMQSVGERMLDDIRKVQGGNPFETQELRAEFFEALVAQQQVALIMTCKAQGLTSEVIGNQLGISSRQVTMIYNEYAGEIGAQIAMVNVGQIIGLSHLAKELAQQGLLQKEDFKGYWTVQRDYVEMLMDLGVIDQAARRVEINVSFDERKQEELSAMLDLEVKRRTRLEELKQIELIQEVTDAVPEIK